MKKTHMRTNLRMPVEVHTAFKQAAAVKRTSMEVLASQIIEEWLATNGFQVKTSSEPKPSVGGQDDEWSSGG